MSLFRKGGAAALMLSALLMIFPATAQGEVTITLVVSSFVNNLLDDALIERFEAEHPGIRVEVTVSPVPGFAPGETEQFLDDTAEFVSQGDVLLVSGSNLTPESTRAGYFLDMSPLVNADADFAPDDFYPQAWQSYQWDGGVWALPASVDVTTLLYDPVAFDEAGLFYPDEFWTLVEFENALRTLSETDASGNITKTALLNTSGVEPIILSLAGQGVFDPFFDATPRFDNPSLAATLDEWKRLDEDGLFTFPTDGEIDTNDFSMIIGQSLFANLPTFESSRVIAPMPGGRASLNVAAVAISAGTPHPEASYALAEFFTKSPEAKDAFLGALPARQSLVGAQGDDENENPILSFLSGLNADETTPILEGLAVNAFSEAEKLYGGFINTALTKMDEESLDAQAALQEVELEALESLEVASERVGTVNVVIATPEPPGMLAEGEIALTFGIQSFANPLPNEEAWNEAIAAFVEDDPTVGRIDIEIFTPFFGNTLADTVSETDCFYQTNNAVPDADLSLLRSIDPLLNSDPTLSPDDLVEGALSQLRREGQLWGLPMLIQPSALWYNPQIFQNNGAFEPYTDWNTGDFENTLRTLKFSPDDPAPFASLDQQDGTYLLLLIAAYGGLPIDYTVDPFVVNYTDPAATESIRQVLNLVRDGYIDYDPLAGGFSTFFLGDDTEEIIAMYSEALTGLDFGTETEDEEGNVYNLALYPTGQQYNPLAYSVGAAHISAETTEVDSCYRFLSYLTNQPDLFSGMPVRRSAINSPEVLNSQGQAAVDFYNGLDMQMQSPDSVVFPTGFGAGVGGEALAFTWLYRTFDKYVEDENTDLEFELGEAQLFADAYIECLAQLPPFDPTSGDILEAYRGWRDCAVKVDPTTESLFPPL
ncbi:MAG: ABC transporter substrate-binding protein [Aggregatilineales bacterium]